MRNLVVGIFGVMTVATSLVYAAESPAHGDDEIRRVLIHSGSYIDSDTGESDDLAWALTLCELGGAEAACQVFFARVRACRCGGRGDYG